MRYGANLFDYFVILQFPPVHWPCKSSSLPRQFSLLLFEWRPRKLWTKEIAYLAVEETAQYAISLLHPFLGLLLGLCHFFGILLAIDLAECQNICICRPANTMDVKIICPNDKNVWTMTNECKTVKSETHFESFSQHWRHETVLLWQRTDSPPARTPSHWTRTGSPSESS